MIRYLKIAIEESLDAAIWYDKREIGLGSEFMVELDRAYDLIEIRPRDFSIYEFYRGPHEVRRCIIKRFSYIVFYTMWLGKPVVIAVSHTSREPLYWIDRLKTLE